MKKTFIILIILMAAGCKTYYGDEKYMMDKHRDICIYTVGINPNDTNNLLSCVKHLDSQYRADIREHNRRVEEIEIANERYGHEVRMMQFGAYPYQYGDNYYNGYSRCVKTYVNNMEVEKCTYPDRNPVICHNNGSRRVCEEETQFMTVNYSDYPRGYYY